MWFFDFLKFYSFFLDEGVFPSSCIRQPHTSAAVTSSESQDELPSTEQRRYICISLSLSWFCQNFIGWIWAPKERNIPFLLAFISWVKKCFFKEYYTSSKEETSFNTCKWTSNIISKCLIIGICWNKWKRSRASFNPKYTSISGKTRWFFSAVLKCWLFYMIFSMSKHSRYWLWC